MGLRVFALIVVSVFVFGADAAQAQITGPITCDASSEGTMIYNDDQNVMQFCDGSDWIAMGGGSGLPTPPTCTGAYARLQWDGSAWLCLGGDTAPDAFSFTDQTDVAQNTLITSNSVTISGIDAPTPVSISGDGSPEFRINGGSWGTSGDIENGQSLELRLTSSTSTTTLHSATVSVGSVSDQWDVTTGNDPCSGSPSPGDVCADGSVYAGLSPDDNVAMYTTPADAPSLMSWNNGTSNWFDTSMVNCTTGTPGSQASCRTGEANTTLLVGLTGNHAPYNAAVYCHNLTAHGHSDWYLPAQDELDVLYDNRAAIGGFNISGSVPAGWYWSSSEDVHFSARTQRFSDGSQSYGLKFHEIAVRCVRR